ncbi:MAG TPA: hypothetical protein VN154_00450 [Rhizomicrobium sp.]|nr:hypothetical protein [Rhizomicrobium sp.]
MTGTLERAWNQCIEDLGGSKPPQCVWDALKARYAETHRAYHTLRHLEECFAWFDQVRSFAARPGEVAFALFCHDAIYDTHAHDNEENSAELGAHVLNEYVRGDGEPPVVASLILATKHNALPAESDSKLLVDIDLSILGAAKERFDEYERQIRLEYDWVSPKDFRIGRMRVLRQFIQRPAIYATDFFRDRLESRARLNLERSLSALNLVP